MFDVRKTLFISSLRLAAVLSSDEALDKTFFNKENMLKLFLETTPESVKSLDEQFRGFFVPAIRGY